MSPESSSPEPTTETEPGLLESATQQDLAPATASDQPGSSEHPAGVAPAGDEPSHSHDGPAHRREPTSAT